jgi:hypothetical protein
LIILEDEETSEKEEGKETNFQVEEEEKEEEEDVEKVNTNVLEDCEIKTIEVEEEQESDNDQYDQNDDDDDAEVAKNKETAFEKACKSFFKDMIDIVERTSKAEKEQIECSTKLIKLLELKIESTEV